MKILSRLNYTYSWMIIVGSHVIWGSHPEFIAFTEASMHTGQFEVTNNDYSVYTCHKVTLSS